MESSFKDSGLPLYMLEACHCLSNPALATILAVQIIYFKLDWNMQFLAPRKTLQPLAGKLEREVVAERAI